MKTRAIIVDDEVDCSTYLSQILKNYEKIDIIGVASSVIDAANLIDSLKPDLVFLDISIPPFTGFDLLKKVSFKKFQVIFCTAHDNYALEALRIGAFDYLLKPINPIELETVLDRLSSSLQKLSIQTEVAQDAYKKKFDKIIISTLESLEIINLDDILYIEASGNYAYFYLQNGSSTISSKGLGYYLDILPEQSFFQCHKKFCVNMNYVVRYIRGEGGLLVLKTGAEIPVSDRKKDVLIKIFKYKSGD